MNQELIKFKKMNKEARLKKALKLGYNNSEEYIAFLEGDNSKGPQVKPTLKENAKKKASTTKPKGKPTIHIVDIVDCSTSMSGTKIHNAVKAVNEGVVRLKEDTIANYKYTLCTFSYYNSVNILPLAVPVSEITRITFAASGSTALYDAIGKTLQKIGTIKGKDEKVLVNIYTDGGENDSRNFTGPKVAELIEKYKEEGFTVTFIGTPQDTKNVISRLKIDKSNTLSYDGTAQGLEKSMNMTLVSRGVYAESVAAGEDVSRGFYKKL